MLGQKLRRLASLAIKQRHCPFCGWRGFRFDPFGNVQAARKDALCPNCGSLERQRTAFVLLRERIPRGQKVLHAAPEPIIVPWLVSISAEYLNVDLTHPAMRQMDLTAIELPSESRTLIWCSHVLEHIVDDRQALAEMFRVLEPGGLLVLQVPIGGDVTHEDPTVTSEADRLRVFLQEDHVRLYGRDLKDRVEAAGFDCELLSVNDLPAADRTLHGLNTQHCREVFLCWKPPRG